MKNALVVLIVVLMVVAFTAFTFAARPDHPPVPEPSVNIAPDAAAIGLHTACTNLDPEGKAFHIFLYRLGPGPH